MNPSTVTEPSDLTLNISKENNSNCKLKNKFSILNESTFDQNYEIIEYNENISNLNNNSIIYG